MSQNDAPQQQGILGVRSFAVQLDSDSDAGSVRSNGIDSPPLERKPEERDSARRATLAALGLVPGPPPPVQPSQQQASSPNLTPRGGSAFAQPAAQKPARDLAASTAAPVQKAEVRRPSSPVQPLGGSSFGSDSWQNAALFNPSGPSGGRAMYNNLNSKSAGSRGLPTDESLTKDSTSRMPETNHTGNFISIQRAPMNAVQEVEAAEAAAPQLGSAGVDRTSSGGATGSASGTALASDPATGSAAGTSPSSPPTSLVPSSPFQAVQVFDTAEPFVTPSVPPIRTKGPSPSPSSTPAVRSSSRFTERFTSPTTTRIVDELLDEVVAHRLTPRDSASSGRQNEHPARPRGRGSGGEDGVDLPRVKPAQDIPRGPVQGSSFRDLETAAPSSVAAGAQPGVPEGESSRSSSQALSEEQRSNSIGEELKMVMKSERGGRLARNSAELLAGDRPGEFTVVTEEGSTIPVAVKDVAAAGPTSNAPNSAAALKDVSAPAPATSAPNSAAALKDVAAAAPATSAPKSTAAGDAPVSEVTPTRNWWGSMTAALGLKAATEGEPAPPSRPAEARPEAEAAQAPPGEQSEAAATAEQSEAAAAAEQQPLAVSAFARDVAVKPVSAETADSSAVQGPAAAAGNVVMSPPVKDVPAEDAKPQTTGSGILEPLSADSLRALSLEAKTGPKRAVSAEGRPSLDGSRASRTSSRRASFHMETASSFEEDTLGTVPDPSHRVSLDMMGAPEGSVLAAMVASSAAAKAAAADSAQQQLGTADRTRSEAAFMEAEPLQMTVKKRQPRRPSVQPVPEAPRVTVTAERTRSEIAFDEALPLERPQGRSKQPPPTAVPPSKTSPKQDSPGATWDNAVPLELTRKRAGPAAAAAAPPPAAAAAEEKPGAWEEAIPLEGSSRKSSRPSPSSRGQPQAIAGPSVEVSPQAKPSSKSGRSRRSSSPPPVAPGDFSDEAEFSHDPDLARDDRQPLMHNLVGRYSLESSGTERYDHYIDRAAAYAKAQEGARIAAIAAGHPSPSRASSQGSLDSSCATPFVSSRRMPHLGGIAAGTQAPQLRGIHEGPGMEPEPDIDMPEAGTPTSESDSEEAEGDSLFFPGHDKENDSGKGHGNNMHGLVGVSHASPPPSAFASAQPPRSVFADAQLPPSDSEAETENGSSPAPGTTIRAHGAARRTSSQAEGKGRQGNGRTDWEAEQRRPESMSQKVPEARKPAGFFCCFGRPATRQ